VKRTRRRQVTGLAALMLAGCGGATDSTEVSIGGASIKLDAQSPIEISIEGRTHKFEYLANCTMSPLMSGVLAYDEEPDFDSGKPFAMLRIAAITEDGNSFGQIEFNDESIGYAFEGPIFIDGKKLSWSGVFEKFDRTTFPKPPVKIDEVNGEGNISC